MSEELDKWLKVWDVVNSIEGYDHYRLDLACKVRSKICEILKEVL